MKENPSEVARIREQISVECEAMRQGMYGIAEGVARHAFITARLENVGTIGQQLIEYIGPDNAWLVIGEIYDKTMSNGS